LGGGGFGPRPREAEPRDVQRVLAGAIEAGVELVDVSPAWGESEALAGEVIRELRARDRVALATHVVGKDALYPAAQVQRAVEASLRATRLDVLPLVWLGPWRDGWLASTAWPELRGTMQRMVREGKALAWGVIIDDAPGDDALAALGEPVFAAAQLALHLRERRALPLITEAAKQDLAVIVRSPLGGGAHTGDVGDLAGIARVEWREQASDLAEVALRWALDRSGVTAAIVGARSADHVAHAIAAGDGRALSSRLRAALDESS
jgi:aryl-alcohol dehydrogenase-like predicted oxidoreductase